MNFFVEYLDHKKIKLITIVDYYKKNYNIIKRYINS